MCDGVRAASHHQFGLSVFLMIRFKYIGVSYIVCFRYISVLSSSSSKRFSSNLHKVLAGGELFMCAWKYRVCMQCRMQMDRWSPSEWVLYSNISLARLVSLADPGGGLQNCSLRVKLCLQDIYSNMRLWDVFSNNWYLLFIYDIRANHTKICIAI